jgi:hypothetical protein
MAHCFVSGLQIEMNDALVLNVGAAWRVIRDLEGQASRLKRLVDQLGPKDRVQITSVNGKATLVRHHRRLVSRAVADAIATAWPQKNLFVPWTVWCARGRLAPIMTLRDHPDHGPRVRRLTLQQAQQVLALSDDVLDRLAPAIRLSFDVRSALVAGVCVVLRDRPAEEITEILADRLRRGASLSDLGVPYGVEDTFRTTLGYASHQPWAVPAPSAQL